MRKVNAERIETGAAHRKRCWCWDTEPIVSHAISPRSICKQRPPVKEASRQRSTRRCPTFFGRIWLTVKVSLPSPCQPLAWFMALFELEKSAKKKLSESHESAVCFRSFATRRIKKKCFCYNLWMTDTGTNGKRFQNKSLNEWRMKNETCMSMEIMGYLEWCAPALALAPDRLDWVWWVLN